MTELTRAQVKAMLEPGDGIAVENLKPTDAQAGIQFVSRGRANHFLCALGGEGLDLVEADVTGVTHTSLDNYLRGNCVLKIYRVRPAFSVAEKQGIRQDWLDAVGQNYGFGAVRYGGEATLVRRYVVPHWPHLGGLLLRDISRAAEHALPDCSALWVGRVQKYRPRVFPKEAAALITPERIVRHESKAIELTRTLDRPIMRKEDR